jgi:predicted O-methyltransferase YrrM
MARGEEPSLLLSLDDEPWKPSQRLYHLAVDIASLAPRIQHRALETRHSVGRRWFEYFPGEHYNLLTALSMLLGPSIIWEFGTDTGMSALAMREGSPLARIYTVDTRPWPTTAEPWLLDADFADEAMTQLVASMAAPDLFEVWGECIAGAELIFVDGPKDGATEREFLARLAAVPFRRCPIVVFDDIRVMNMVRVWRAIARPKMDMTSYGHHTGTGLVDWCGTL